MIQEGFVPFLGYRTWYRSVGSAAGGKVPVDYTRVKYVKKPAGAMPGRVIYTDYSTMIVEPDPALAERLRAEK